MVSTIHAFCWKRSSPESSRSGRQDSEYRNMAVVTFDTTCKYIRLLCLFLGLSCGYVSCRQTEAWRSHDHFYRARNLNKWREARTTWLDVNRGVANFSVFNGKLFSFQGSYFVMLKYGTFLAVMKQYTTEGWGVGGRG